MKGAPAIQSLVHSYHTHGNYEFVSIYVGKFVWPNLVTIIWVIPRLITNYRDMQWPSSIIPWTRIPDAFLSLTCNCWGNHEKKNIFLCRWTNTNVPGKDHFFDIVVTDTYHIKNRFNLRAHRYVQNSVSNICRNHKVGHFMFSSKGVFIQNDYTHTRYHAGVWYQLPLLLVW